MQVEAYMSALSTQPFVEFSILLFIDSFVSFFEKKKKTTFVWEKVKKIHQHVPLN